MIAALKALANELLSFIRGVGRKLYGRRFDPVKDAQDFIGEVVDSSRVRSMSERWRPDTPVSTDILGEIADLSLDVRKAVKLADVKRINAFVKRNVQTGAGQGLMNALAPAITTMRSWGYEGKQLGNFFERPSRGGVPETGYLAAYQALNNKESAAFGRAVGIPNEWGKIEQWKTPEIQAVLAEAEAAGDEGSTAEVSPQAQKVLDYFKRVYDQYNLSELKAEMRHNYYPRGLNLEIIRTQTGRARMEALIVEYLPDTDKNVAKNIVDGILSDATTRSESEASVEGIPEDGFAPGVPHRLARTLEAIPTRALRENNLALPADEVATTYIYNLTKRVEFEKRGGNTELVDLMQEVVKKHPHLERQVEYVVRGVMGQTDVKVSPAMRTILDIAQTVTIFTLLPLALLSQFPEIGFALTRGQGVVGFREAIKMILNKEDLKTRTELARSIGAVAPSAMQAMLSSVGSLEWQSRGSKRATEWFFRITGLDAFTTFIKGLSAGMGREFLRNAAADPTERNQRYLKELGVTAEQVKDWIADDMNLENHPFVEEALLSFTREASVAPNPAIRPALGNNPYLRVLYTLKTFFYGTGVQILAGMAREIRSRWQAGEKADAAIFISYALATTLPLAAVALEVREGVKWGLRLGFDFVGLDVPDPSTAFLSDNMGGFEYMTEIIDRAGLLGPATIAKGMLDSMSYDQNVIASMVPAVDFVSEVISGNADQVMPVMRTI